jgi:hypothetical protein
MSFNNQKKREKKRPIHSNYNFQGKKEIVEKKRKGRVAPSIIAGDVS